MQLAQEVQRFTSGCEGLLAAIAMHRPLNDDEARIVEYYCKELLEKIPPYPKDA